MKKNFSLKDMADELENSLYIIAKDYSSNDILTVRKNIAPKKYATVGLFYGCEPIIKIQLIYSDESEIKIEQYDSIPLKYKETNLPTELNLLLNNFYIKIGKQQEGEIKNYIQI